VPGESARVGGQADVAFTYDSLDALLNTYVRLRDHDSKPILSVNRGPTSGGSSSRSTQTSTTNPDSC
jgi:hypothetical protein